MVLQEEKILKSLYLALSWCENRPTYSIRSSDNYGIRILKILKKLSIRLHNLLPEELKARFKPIFSRGKSSLPAILWVSLCPINKNVHSSMTVTICFSRSGNGFVCGIIDAIMIPQRWLELTKRTDLKINIDVDSNNFKYNNVFHNPIEFEKSSISVKKLINHINHSSKLLNEVIIEKFPTRF